MFSGGEEPAAVADETAIVATPLTSPTGSAGTLSMTEAERLALVQIDPEMKAATDYIGSLINMQGYLCAQISNVEPATESSYKITCVERRDGSGRVQYLVDDQMTEVTPL